MRLTLFSIAAVALAAGCKSPPPEQIEKRFIAEIRLWINNLNQEALARKETLRRERAQADENPALKAPSGTIYSQYTWDVAGFVVDNFKCRICEVKLLLPFPSAEYLCRSCGHCPYATGHTTNAAELKKSPCVKCLDPKGMPREPAEALKKETFQAMKGEGVGVKEMFEVTDPATKEKPLMRANVRYVRRVWSFDDKATVSLTQKAIERGLSDPSFIPLGAEVDLNDKYSKYQRAGFHRPDTMYVGEIRFEFRGGELIPLSVAKEEPVRQWKDILGNKN